MSDLTVELVFALPERQVLRALVVAAGATVRDVICASDIQTEFVDVNITEFATGIWGREVALDHKVKSGDRVEIYRPLELEPREARRQLALLGKTMSGSEQN